MTQIIYLKYAHSYSIISLKFYFKHLKLCSSFPYVAHYKICVVMRLLLIAEKN